MKVLAFEAYYGGSHRAFLDGWIAHSRHQWRLVSLPAAHWKWRMRHAAITMASQVASLSDSEADCDLVFATDMLNLAELRGLCPRLIAAPAVLYFHENQLTYPVRVEEERDLHFGVTNLVSALAADEVWFNSAYHRRVFLTAIEKLVQRAPDHRPKDAAAKIDNRSQVQCPGIDSTQPGKTRRPGPLRILWAARWEHDKNPELFFAAIERLAQQGTEFRLMVIGQSFAETPAVFAAARRRLADQIDVWGYQDDRTRYRQVLSDADVVVSTANHEFFGLAVVEAIAAGAYPLLPDRLAYPEIVGADRDQRQREFLYVGGAAELAERLAACAARLAADSLWSAPTTQLPNDMARFYWPRRAAEMDAALEQVRDKRVD